MPLHFPNLKTLRLALSTGAVPEKIAAAPLRAVLGDDADVLILAKGRLPAGASQKLKALGVTSRRGGMGSAQNFCCWQQLLPAEKVAGEAQVNEKSVVLFELRDSAQLPELVDEMLRLGNDRQAFRHVQIDGSQRTLLKVTGAPYYSLLRAIDGQAAGNGSAAPIAYVEQASRVWVQLGYRHASAGNLKPRAGQMLFIRPPHEWTFLDEAPLEDIYSVLDFPLPRQPSAAEPRVLNDRLQVPLRLVEGGADDDAELWVLKSNAIDQIEQFVRAADDRLLSRLSFAVTDDDNPTVVLRARPSKRAAPVLVLDALGCRTHLKLTNLFVPTGWRLHPPLRRDVVAGLLAPDKNHIVWLEPFGRSSHSFAAGGTGLEGQATHPPDGDFTPRSLPDAAFRPLSDWVEYIVERDTDAMDAWVSAYRFDFEPFVCKDDVAEAPKKPPRRKPQPRELRREDSSGRGDASLAEEPEITEHIEIEQEEIALPTAKKPQSADKLQKQLQRIEKQFQDSDEPLESPQRADMWRQMAVLNAALQRRLDGTVCWSNGLWEDRAPPAGLLSSWLQCEQQTSGASDLSGAALDKLTAGSATAPNQANLVAALLVSAAHNPAPPAEVVSRIDVLSRYIQRQESFMPIRAAWLAWTAIVKLSHGDVLALARARDRLLERLYQSGMMAEFDLPSFMRAGGGVEASRLAALRDYLAKLQKLVQTWIVEPPAGPNAQTGTYAELMFAFALARLGELSRADLVVQHATKKLADRDVIHDWLADAFELRIRQAIQGASDGEGLSAELRGRLDQMNRQTSYMVDRMRGKSRILEPHKRLDAFKNWHGNHGDELAKELASMSNDVDHAVLFQRLTALLGKSLRDANRKDLPRVLTTALEISPRLGSDAGRSILGHLPTALDSTNDIVERALLVANGMHAAAHFGEVEIVRSCVAHFERSLADIANMYLSLQMRDGKEQLEALDALLAESLKGLRKLGMRDEIGRLYGQIAELVHGARAGNRKRKPDERYGRTLSLQLVVAGGLYYFGEHDKANLEADEVRGVLFDGKFKAIHQQELACHYLRAVAQAPTEISLSRIREVFESREGDARRLDIQDNMATASHYSLSQLNVIEAALLALVSDDFTMSEETRRWLDEDEYLVRRRLHADVRQALDAAGM